MVGEVLAARKIEEELSDDILTAAMKNVDGNEATGSLVEARNAQARPAPAAPRAISPVVLGMNDKTIYLKGELEKTTKRLEEKSAEVEKLFRNIMHYQTMLAMALAEQGHLSAQLTMARLANDVHGQMVNVAGGDGRLNGLQKPA